MNKVIYYYTIYFKSFPTKERPSETDTFSISYSEGNAPKDRYDHHDAVMDYLIDTNPNPFKPVPDFIIIKTTTEQQDTTMNTFPSIFDGKDLATFIDINLALQALDNDETPQEIRAIAERILVNLIRDSFNPNDINQVEP